MCSPSAMLEEEENDAEHESDIDSDSSDTDDSSDYQSASENTPSEGDDNANEPSNNDELIDEDDAIVKAFTQAKEIQRNCPPSIWNDLLSGDLSFHPNSDIIAVGTVEGDVLLYTYNIENCDLSSTLESHTDSCRCVEFNFDGKTIYSAANDLAIVATDVETGKMKMLIENSHVAKIYSMKLIDEYRFATGDEDGTVKVWDARTHKEIFSDRKTEENITAMITNDSKRFLVCSSGEGVLTTFDLSARSFYVQSEPYDCELTALSLVHNSRKLISSTSDGRFFTFNWNQFGYHSDEFPGPKLFINCMVPITENIVVCGYEDGNIRATHLFPNQQLGIVGQHEISVEQLEVSHDGEYLASTSSADSVVKFWNIRYFEDMHVSSQKNQDKKTVLSHNLPSSNASNRGDFFADMAETS